MGISYHFAHSGFIKENFYKGKDSEEAVKPLDDITVAKISFVNKTYFVLCEKYIKQEEVKCSAIKSEKLR